MKNLVLCLFLVSCEVVVEPPWYPPPIPVPGPVSYPYCGDGVCDIYAGEDFTWCEDCESDWSSYCGDDICTDYEDHFNCPEDCALYGPWHNGTPWDPGYIDPIPFMEKR